MANKRTAERNCMQVIYPGYHLLPGKIGYKRYDQYFDLKQSKKMQWSSNFWCAPSIIASPPHAFLILCIVHQKHPPYHVVTLQTSKPLYISPVGATVGQSYYITK